MLKKIFSSKIASLVLFSILSFACGGINGFLGTGGGIVLIYMLRLLTKNNTRDNFATALCITVPISLIALFNYWKNGNVDFSLTGKIAIPIIIGGILGAFLTDKLKLEVINGAFGVLVAYSGVCLILR